MAIKRNYYLPEALIAHFAKWSKPGRDYSPAVAGAILIWMGLSAELREEAKKLAEKKDAKAAVAVIAEKLHNSIVEKEKQETWDALSDDEQLSVVSIIKEASERLSRKKKDS